MALIAALLAAAGLAQGIDQAPPIREALDRGFWAVQDFYWCAAGLPEAGARYEAILTRYDDAFERADGLFGVAAPPAGIPAERACEAGFAEAAEARAAAAFADAEGRLATVEAGLKQGLWFGVYPLCADTVGEAKLVRGRSGGSAVRVTIVGPQAKAFGAYLVDFGNGDRPVRADVRLDGAVITTLAAEARGRKLELEGLGEPTLARVLATAKAACGGGDE
jgi:hypothetical protein